MQGSAFNPAAWSSFLSAEVSASAALAGLIFVAVSINLPKIVVQHSLVSRSAKALATLAGVLIACTLCLVPAQAPFLLGWELIIVGAVIWVATTIAQHGASSNNPYIGRGTRVLHFTLTQLSGLPVVLAGASLSIGRCGGLYWLVLGIVFSFVSALLDAWVLLVEILR
jgi:hypothetical protein